MTRRKDGAVNDKRPVEGSLSVATVAKIDRLMVIFRLAQADLAKSAGIHQTGVSAILGRRRRPYADQVQSIARALGVSMDWLLDDAHKADDLDMTDDPENYLDRLQSIGFSLLTSLRCFEHQRDAMASTMDPGIRFSLDEKGGTHLRGATAIEIPRANLPEDTRKAKGKD